VQWQKNVSINTSLQNAKLFRSTLCLVNY